MQKANKNIVCYSCRHFFVTWQERYPYGCKAFNMKSKTLPCLKVFQESRKNCLYYQTKIIAITNSSTEDKNKIKRMSQSNNNGLNIGV